MNFFDRANTWINQVENSAVNLLSALAPWLAPIVPMQITVNHMTEYLDFPRWVAWPTGVVVEILGLAAVSTIMRLHRHNQAMRAGKNRQPVWIPVLVYLFYLAIVLSVIALPEFAKDRQDWIAVAVKIMLALLSVPAAITLAIRAQNTEIVQEVTAQKNRKKPENLPASLPELSGKVSDWRKLPKAQRARLAEMSTGEIVEKFGVPERTARNWRSRVHKNGQGVEVLR